ncbi:MAG: heme-binding protein [Rhodoplanes sp.]|uniref:SOUL family heme-binding protein n=1 Tax=Rhodoplanes sp. TaxID=1968906 RepID=UPI001823E749|nr:heme-binding protein [Rhodoplanes sp.]NVO15570.1 heme-binding protein [Rhodoplanes sp.]
MSLISSIVQGAAGVVGIRSGTEEPRFAVVERIGGAVEVRRYEPRLAADVIVEGDETEARSAGFRRLARFIFGANTARQSIAMTAPVAQAPAGSVGSEKIAMTAPVAQMPVAPIPAGPRGGSEQGWTIRFTMPGEYTRDTLPVPDDAGIAIVDVPAETVAVIVFSGATSVEAVHHQARLLRRILGTTDWRIVGPPVAQFYDPPWTLPMLRRNEVAVRVER